MSDELDIPGDLPTSEKQHRLLQAKLDNRIAQSWSNPKFMTFLYNTYLRTPSEQKHVGRLRKVHHRRVNIDEMLENRNRIGKLSEAYALRWEKERLHGAGHAKLVKKIKDCRDRPGCGYDFLSHSEPGKERFIEVKSAGKLRTSQGYRFFLSDTEHRVSRTADAKDNYYFYLVFYDEAGEPTDLQAWTAEEVYAISELGPNGYIVSFNFDRTDL
ncbi:MULTISPECIES: DUF3883 domain-containing protein [unclassified Bradyrhizobium]|uniref:DUF3883 domain-containing protein n=1 Tax=unclassified Bradyrhizobium TaxID=2631580 RepID=UPI0028F0E637|nr:MULTISPECIES: DUF3883 domain-containing protein [unclassified Bradyrhizobium]